MRIKYHYWEDGRRNLDKKYPVKTWEICGKPGRTLPVAVVNFSLKAQMVAKLESFNPLSSVKDRIGVAMIDAAEEIWADKWIF